jgi:hydrogenase-4 component F
MIYLAITLLLPLLGALLMLLLGRKKIAGFLNIFVSGLGFISAVLTGKHFLQHGPFLFFREQLFLDYFNLLAILLTTFIVFTTAIFSQKYMWHNVSEGKISKRRLRLYHVLYQLFALTMLLALAANNLGILWIAMEGATLATVLLVSLYRTKEAIEAAWKYFILCIIGIALALFGTILIYFSASQSAFNSHSGLLWTALINGAKNLDPVIIKLAFVFLLVGYGTKIGLVPLHNWLPDAHSESPAPMSTLLSGLLLNVALYALVRFKVLTNLVLQNNLAGNLMMSFGLLSFVVAVVLMQRQKNIKRLFSYSSIEHMGLITFAFGLNTAASTFCAIFYFLMHALTKSAVFVIVGNVIQTAKTQSLEKIRGLINGRPVLGWSLLIATLAISGIPPFGIFTSEFLLVVATLKTIPLLAIILVIGLIIALSGMLRNIQPVTFGEASPLTNLKISLSPALLHLGLILILGVYLPPVLHQVLMQAVKIIIPS